MPSRAHRRVLAALVLAATAASCGTSTGLVDGPGSAPAQEPSATEQPPWPEGVETFEDVGFDHVEGPVDYEVTPPPGGDHALAWQNCGIYDSPVADENAVHSLEHGAVWLTYRPDLPADQVEHLRALVGSSGYVLLSPYEDQDSPVVATAWSVQLRVDDATDARVERFLTEYVLGEQSREPGASCTGGVGEPLQSS